MLLCRQRLPPKTFLGNTHTLLVRWMRANFGVTAELRLCNDVPPDLRQPDLSYIRFRQTVAEDVSILGAVHSELCSVALVTNTLACLTYFLTYL